MFALLALAFAATPSLAPGYVSGRNPKAYRLSGDAVPRAYRIAFDVQPAMGTFSGAEEIAVDLRRPAREVVLHAADLQITDARIEQPGDGPPQQAAIVPHAESETLSMIVARPLPVGPALLKVAFRARLRDDLRGLYLVEAKDGSRYAFTQFEPADARRAFPCFDEPAFKATYDVSVTVPPGMQAVGNGPALPSPTDPRTGAVTWRFATTPPISTYLVALAVGRFSSIGPKTAGAHGTPIQVVTLPGEEALGTEALADAAALLPWYERQFGIPYPYAKLDLVAVPDFEAGAMENAGAIFFRDRDLLLDSAHASVQQQKTVAIVVAHEMAHQWFGDLVTMKWWDDLWLNEAFASLMENESVAALHPAWKIWDLFRAESEGALYDDALKTTHAIHSPVATVEEANEAFDDITYIKGQACLRMIERFLGPKGWWGGIHDYLASHALGNATEEDLWQALAAASRQPVGAIAKSWFEQPGYPLLSVRRRGKRLDYSQRRFFLNPKDASDSKALWQVPACVKTGGRSTTATTCALLSSEAGSIELPGARWADASAEGAGFYRVAYAPPDLAALHTPLRAGTLSAPEQIALLADTWALARAGASGLAPLLSLVADLPALRSAPVAGEVAGDLATLERRLLAPRDRPRFAAFVESLFGPTLAGLGWDSPPGEDPERRELRATAISTLGVIARDPAVVAEAQRRLGAWEKDPKALDGSLVGALLGIAARHGDAALWDDFELRMSAAATPEEHDHFLYALAEFRRPELIRKSLALAVSGKIRKQDTAGFLGALLRQRDATDATWAFVTSHWPEVVARSTPQSLAWRFLPSVGSLCTPKAREKAASFFAAHPVEAGGRPLANALESIDLCVRLQKLHAGELGKWLARRPRPARPTAAR